MLGHTSNEATRTPHQVTAQNTPEVGLASGSGEEGTTATFVVLCRALPPLREGCFAEAGEPPTVRRF